MTSTIPIPQITSPDPHHQELLRDLLTSFQSSDLGLSNAIKNLCDTNNLSTNDELFWLMVLENQIKQRYNNPIVLQKQSLNVIDKSSLLNSSIRIEIRKVLLGLVKLHTDSSFQLQIVSTTNQSGNFATGDSFVNNNNSKNNKILENGDFTSLLNPIVTKLAVLLVKIFQIEYLDKNLSNGSSSSPPLSSSDINNNNSTSWKTFFDDLWSLGNFDLYLRILEAVDVEIVDRTFENLKSSQEQQHATAIKDQMRISDVPRIISNLQFLFEACSKIITNCQPKSSSTSLNHNYKDKAISILKQIINIYSRYISWIDIDLITSNQDLFNLLVATLTDEHLRETGVKSFIAMTNKGMLPEVKLNFIKMLYPILAPNFMNLVNNIDNTLDKDVDYLKGIAEFYGSVLSGLSAAFLVNPLLGEIMQYLEELFVPISVKLLLNEWNDIGWVWLFCRGCFFGGRAIEFVLLKITGTSKRFLYLMIFEVDQDFFINIKA